jgi:hypothetical protein
MSSGIEAFGDCTIEPVTSSGWASAGFSGTAATSGGFAVFSGASGGRGIGVSGSARSRLSSPARRNAANRRSSGARDMRARIARRIERQEQDRDGEEYAAYWNHSKNRQHRLCITESVYFPNTNAESFSRPEAIATHP